MRSRTVAHDGYMTRHWDVRIAEIGDLGFLERMLYEAAN
jgi:hypothetical protein